MRAGRGCSERIRMERTREREKEKGDAPRSRGAQRALPVVAVGLLLREALHEQREDGLEADGRERAVLDDRLIVHAEQLCVIHQRA